MCHISLSRYLIEEQREKHWIAGDLRLLIEGVARACKSISIAISKGALAGMLGSAGAENVQGEVQKKLDVISNEIFLEANEWGGHLAAMASEEMEGPHQIPHRFPKGEYLLLIDPLDGSSNIDVKVSVGSIFSVLRCPEGPDGRLGETDVDAFMYTRDLRHVNGRLRLMYEANPMAVIVEQAGGAASDGNRRILDLEPVGQHQRVGLHQRGAW